MKYTLSLFILSFFLFSCGSEKQEQVAIQAPLPPQQLTEEIKQAKDSSLNEKIIQEVLEENTIDEQKTVIEEVIEKLESDFSIQLCSLVTSNPDVFLLENITTKDFNFEFALRQLIHFQTSFGNCNHANKIFTYENHELYILSTINKDNVATDFLMSIHLDKEKKIRDFNFIGHNDDNMEIKLYQIPTNEPGITLPTVVISHKHEQRSSIYSRTPYFDVSINSYSWTEFINYYNEGYNYVIQPNRGTNGAPGRFRWLHQDHIADGKTTIDWIAKQPFSDAHVATFGLSYDGHNALASAVENPEALKLTIACSAPTSPLDDSLTNMPHSFGILSYVQSREKSEEISNFYYKARYLTNRGDVEADQIDNIIDKDSEEWNLFVKSLFNEKAKKEFMIDRNLSKKLNQIQTPTYFIGGLILDQDARDSILAFNKTTESNFHLFLGDWGHDACVVDHRVTRSIKILLKKYLINNATNEVAELRQNLKEKFSPDLIKQELAYSQALDQKVIIAEGDLVYVDNSYPTKYQKDLEVNASIIHNEININFKENILPQNVLAHTFADDTTILGEIELCFEASANIPFANMTLNTYIPQAKTPLTRIDYSIGVYFENQDRKNVCIKSAPIYHHFKAGEKIVFNISFLDYNAFNFTQIPEVSSAIKELEKPTLNLYFDNAKATLKEWKLEQVE